VSKAVLRSQQENDSDEEKEEKLLFILKYFILQRGKLNAD